MRVTQERRHTENETHHAEGVVGVWVGKSHKGAEHLGHGAASSHERRAWWRAVGVESATSRVSQSCGDCGALVCGVVSLTVHVVREVELLAQDEQRRDEILLAHDGEAEEAVEDAADVEDDEKLSGARTRAPWCQFPLHRARLVPQSKLALERE